MKQSTQAQSRKRVLIFNEKGVLSGLTDSVIECSKMTGNSVQSISQNCRGLTHSCDRYYFRYEEGYDLKIEEIGNLSVKDFDKMTGNYDRKYRFNN